MKFGRLGYANERDWDAMSKFDQDALIEECFRYDDQLRRGGHWIEGGQALESARNAKTLRWKDGTVAVTDGPFAETKEQLGGLGVLEARDLDHAIELMAKHPAVRLNTFEIRPINEEAPGCQTASDLERVGKAAVPPGAAAQRQRFASLGYVPEHNWDTIPQHDRDKMIAECMAFDEARRNNGQWLGGIALQQARTAKTLRSSGSQVLVTDGPYAETKEQLGGMVLLGLNDMHQAVELLSKHPALRFGVSIEIRPIDEEFTARWEARQTRN
jgi:hypothetical protein